VENGQLMTHVTGAKANELPDFMHTCYCGFSLIGAYDYLGGQMGVSRVLLSHIQSVHGVAK
jgi:hypothetical protein